MRLFLLPITTRRSLLFCQRIHVTTTDKQGLIDKITNKAAKVWASWEKKEQGWQKKLVEYGNYGLRRIPYEEWGLKSVPPISARRKDEELQERQKVELTFPGAIIPPDRVEKLLKTMATERDALHRKRLIWCCIGMPITAPFALVPVYVPPIHYEIFRAHRMRGRSKIASPLTRNAQNTQRAFLLPCLPRLVPLARPRRRRPPRVPH